MSYDYATEKPRIFTEDGMVMFLAIRDRMYKLMDESGACRVDKALSGISGASWLQLACIDRLVEMGEFRWVDSFDQNKMTQHRVLVKTRG